jgi:hypothetical protein
MPRSGPSREDAGLIEETGVSLPALERWRAAGILPRNVRHGLGRGRGSASFAGPETAELIRALRAHAQRGRPVHEAVLAIFCGHPQLRLPEPGVFAALTWFSRDRGKGLASAIERAAGPHASVGRGEAAAAGRETYDAAIDAVFDVTQNLRTGKRRFLGTAVADPRVDTVRAAEAFPALVTGLMLGVNSIGADEYMRATGEFSAAIGQHAILTDQDLAGLGRRLRQAERAGEALSAGAAGKPLITCPPIGQVPFDSICQVRDQLAIMAEVAASAAVIIAASQETRASSLLQEPAFVQLEQARASSLAVRAYMLFPPPLSTAEPSHAWKQMTHFIVRSCTHPGVPIVLAGAAQAVAPMLAPLQELAGRIRARPPDQST